MYHDRILVHVSIKPSRSDFSGEVWSRFFSAKLRIRRCVQPCDTLLDCTDKSAKWPAGGAIAGGWQWGLCSTDNTASRLP